MEMPGVSDENYFDGNCFSSSAMDGGEPDSRDVPDKGVDIPPCPKPVYDPTSLYYDMSGEKLMYIFNHDNYQNSRHFNHPLSPRRGSVADVVRLKKSFGNLKFNVEDFNNFTHGEILDKLNEICTLDHSSTSCVAIVILTHGDRGGTVCAADKPYQLSDVINYLLYEPRLAGKPKLFFIQACRGGNADPGHRVQIDGRSAVIIPSHSDSLVLMATFDEFASYRSSTGSWMIQTLCDVVDKHHLDQDILHMMTFVNHTVAKKITSTKEYPEYNEKKQIPEVRFTLTKFLKF